MKLSLMVLALSCAIATGAHAQAIAPAVTAKSATVTAICKDGTPFSGESLKGACSGHGGVDKKATKAESKPVASAKAADKATDKAADKAADKVAPKVASAPMAQAPGGGADKVWGNDSSKVYHCPGDKWYGKTKKGEYMSEADAKAKGYHADHGKPCVAK